MDKRMSKETLLKEIDGLNEILEKVYIAGMDGIGYVAMANYSSREEEAIKKLDDARFGEEEINNAHE